MKASSNSALLLLFALVALLIPMTASPVVAHPNSNEPLSVAFTLASAKTIVPGQPIVLRYSIVNASAVTTVHLDLGQNETSWYHLSLVDTRGKSAQILPDLRPLTHSNWGLYQTGSRVLSPGDSLTGSIVVTRSFAVTRPGTYLLTVQVPLSYTLEDKAEILRQEAEAPTTPQLDQNFTCQIEAGAANPAAVQATAEALSRKLTDLNVPAADQWEPVAEELFSMPQAQALSSWQALVNNPATPDGVRVEVANQLAYHPSRAAANLLTQMLWNTPLTTGGTPLLTELSRSEIARALVTMKDVASPDVKQQIRLLNSQHQGQTSDVREPSRR